MIFDAILTILFGVIEGVLALLPSWSWSLGGSGAAVGEALATANGLFPVVTLGACLLALVALRGVLVAVALIAWVWDKVPFKAS